MTESETLASLTIKDLRQLAGEHQITNRSRLGREELIQALQAAIANRTDAVSALPESALSAPAADPAVQADVAPAVSVAPAAEAPLMAVAAAVGDSPAPVSSPQAVAAPSEPEELDASVVAEVTGSDDDGDAGEGEDDGQPGDGGPEGDPNRPQSDEPGRRRRRRRRGRGRGQGGQGGPQQQQQPQSPQQQQPQQQTIDLGATASSVAVVPAQAQPSAADAPAGAAADVPPVAAAQQQRRGDGERRQDDRRNDDRRHDDRRNDDRRNDDRRNDDRRQQGDRRQGDAPRQGEPMRQPRPRLDGPQRPVPTVLDRLCTFSKGLLELCDPSTPSWAQPRLAELLAEAGVVPTPAAGQPHADFHQVVGTVQTTAVPPGHIAEVTSPGFSLRGDRGDLFCLRKAQVRIAIQARAAGTAPAPAPSSVTSHEAPAMVGVEAPVAAAEPVAVSPAVSAGPVEIVPESDLIPPRPEPPPPAVGRTPNRTHVRERADEAPALPLAAQVPEELAARPKAEGFRPLGLNDQVLADLAAMGWNEPTPIQAEAIPHVLVRKDVLGQAQTGTGKTGAFVLPMLQRLYSLERPRGSAPAVLVLLPTRELARQVHAEFVKMAGASGARAALIYGGVPMDEQYRHLDRHPHVVIGTPGRIIDHMKRHTLDLSKLEMLVLDEADQMLDIGFWPDIQYIVGHTPPSRQMLLFSATFPQPVLDLITRHMVEPVHVRIAPKQVTVEQVDQKYIAVGRERKNALLAYFIESQNPPQMVVFCKTKHQTDRVAEVLKRKNMSAEAIHGDLPQTRRERTLARFRENQLQCLIATNVAARGLDIPSVSHVVNYDIPETPEEYVHRIGRTARNGAKGIARTFITPDDGQFLLEIEKHIGLLLEEEVIEGFSNDPAAKEGPKRILAETEPGTFRLLKPISGGIKLGRRR